MTSAANHQSWTREEDRAFRVLYPDYNALQRRFPRRTYFALRNHAQELGIQKTRHVWTQSEVARLKRLHTGSGPKDEQLIEAFPGLNIKQIRAQASFRGFKRQRTAPVRLGVPILDAIRDKAFREGFTLTDLDRLAGTQRYFQKSMKHISWKHVCAGVEFLGGELKPLWYDEDNNVEEVLPIRRIA